MQLTIEGRPGTRHDSAIDGSKRDRRATDGDTIRGRRLDFSQKFLPDGLSLAPRLRLPHEGERRLLSRIQGRTYANMAGLVEWFIRARAVPADGGERVGARGALAAPVPPTGGERERGELLRRLESMIACGMRQGYAFGLHGSGIASSLLGRSPWAVMALTCHVEMLAQAHARLGVEPDPALSPLFRDVLAYHGREASRNAILDELLWRREHAKLTPAQRDAAVDDLIALFDRLDRMLRGQARSDASYFAVACGRTLRDEECAEVDAHVLAAYRWQYIVSGAQQPRFCDILQDLVTPSQLRRIGGALSPLVGATRWAS